MRWFKKKIKKQLIDKRIVNSPTCIRFFFDNHIVHSNAFKSNNTVIEQDTGDCIICTRLSDYDISEIWAEHPKYSSSKEYSDTMWLFRYKRVIPEWCAV